MQQFQGYRTLDYVDQRPWTTLLAPHEFETFKHILLSTKINLLFMGDGILKKGTVSLLETMLG